MFEESLVESQGALGASNRPWTTVVSVVLQCSLATLLATIPLLHPETLRVHVEAPRVLPTLRRDPPPVARAVPAHAATTAMATAPAMLSRGRPLIAPNSLPSRIDSSDAPIASFSEGPMGAPLPTGLSGGTTGHGIRVVPAPTAASRTVRVSEGVSAGLLLEPIRPVYPRIAAISRVEGTVVVEAILSKSGRIESAHVLSGPVMLRPAALEAVTGARYSPYKLNGEPTDVETTITINFRLGG
jgi:protein TonB